MTLKNLIESPLEPSFINKDDLVRLYEPETDTFSAYHNLVKPTGANYLIGEKGIGKSQLLSVLSVQLKTYKHDVLFIFPKDWLYKIESLKNKHPDIQLSDAWLVEIISSAVQTLLQSDEDGKIFTRIKNNLINQYRDRLEDILTKINQKHLDASIQFETRDLIESLNGLLWEILLGRQNEKPIIYNKKDSFPTEYFPAHRSLYIFIDKLENLENIEDIRALMNLMANLHRQASHKLGESLIPNFKIIISMETQTYNSVTLDYVDSQLISVQELLWSKKSIKRFLVRRMLPDVPDFSEDLVTQTLQAVFPEPIYYFGVEFKSPVDFILEITGLNPRRVLIYLQTCERELGSTDSPYGSGLSAQEIINGLERYSSDRAVFISDELYFIYPNLRGLLAYLSAHREGIQRILPYKNLSSVIQAYLSDHKVEDEKPKWLQGHPDSIINILYEIGVVGFINKTNKKVKEQDWTQANYYGDNPHTKISTNADIIVHPSFWHSITNIKDEIILHRRLALNIYSSLRDATKKLDEFLEKILLDTPLSEFEKEEDLGKFLAITNLIINRNFYPEPKDLVISQKTQSDIEKAFADFSATVLCAPVKGKTWGFVVRQTADFYSKALLSYLPTIGHDKIKFNNQNVFFQKRIELSSEYLHIQSAWLKGDKINYGDKKLIENFKNYLSVGKSSLIASLSESLEILQGAVDIPPELLQALKSSNFVIEYLSQPVTKIRDVIGEIKMLIVGQGSVGKTSIINRILFGNFRMDETKTEGISIDHWQVDDQRAIDNPPPQFRLNLWDFGGQEIMHATHQFFLTKRSLYILVLDSRLTQEENRVEYWLKIIQSFSDESPVLIVGNKIDQHSLDIDRTGLQKKYPNIVGILEVSAATGAGIEELKAAITEQVNILPHVRDLLPETWFTVKTKLEELAHQKNFILYDEYLGLCAENNINDDVSQSTLIGFLHDLGVVLRFQDDPRLEGMGVLNPQWVTNGVYKILNSKTLFQNKGVLTFAMLEEILNTSDYPRGKRLFIVDMMKKFELCYDIESVKTFLVPDLLPKDQPDLQFNGIPAFEYAYPVLPSSVITRFIVRMNQKIDDGLVWRTGVVLKIGENKALVKADIEDRKITIAIDGVEHTRRDALSAIRYELDEIHNSVKGLNPQKRVPVPNAPLAEPLKYDYLLKLERSGQEFLPVENGNDLVTVNVRQVLSAIETEAQRKEQGSVTTNYYIQGDVNASGDFVGRDKNITARDRSVIVGGNVSGNLVSGNYNKINSAEIDPELKDTLLQLGEAVDAMIQKLPAEQATEVAEDFGKLTDEAIKPKPNQKWYSVSIEGLIKAAENLDKLGTPVISLSRKVLSLLTGGVIK